MVKEVTSEILLGEIFDEIAIESKDGSWLLLKYLAFLNPYFINSTLFMEIMGKTMEEMENDIRIIIDGTVFIKIYWKKEKLIIIHRQNIQRIMKTQLKKEEVSEILEIFNK